MKNQNSTRHSAVQPVAPARPAYEPPRILAKRPVERVTLSFTEPVGPGGGIGEQP